MVREREVSGLTVAELGFPPGYVQPRLDPELPYLAFVLDGGLEKSFARRRVGLGRARAVTIPAGAAHGAPLLPSDRARLREADQRAAALLGGNEEGRESRRSEAGR